MRSEYRSDLRDIPHDKANKGLIQTFKNIMQPKKGKKPNLRPSQPRRLKVPGVGTMVVDYDLTGNPADANVITLWASQMTRLAKDVLQAPRGDCANCVRKHLGQAAALLQESLQGYPEHTWLAIGHLAEAEAESQNKFPEFAEKLRAARKMVESGKGYPNVPELIAEMNELVKGKDIFQESSGCPV